MFTVLRSFLKLSTDHGTRFYAFHMHWLTIWITLIILTVSTLLLIHSILHRKHFFKIFKSDFLKNPIKKKIMEIIKLEINLNKINKKKWILYARCQSFQRISSLFAKKSVIEQIVFNVMSSWETIIHTHIYILYV